MDGVAQDWAPWLPKLFLKCVWFNKALNTRQALQALFPFI